MATFKAIRIDKADKGTVAALTQFDEAELMEGDVTIAVEWSTLNYKDGLAVTGKAPVVRRFPMIAGIDLAGTVEQSSHPQWKPGDKVICDGWGMGETHLGAYAEKARVKGDWLVRLPDGMSTREAMAIGTAGYTAMLSVLALEKHGLTPKSGPVVVTGLTWLSTIPPTSSLVALMFGTRWLATLYGFAFFSHQVGGFLGVLLGGIVFEKFGSYTPIWWLSVLFGVLSALINLPIVEAPVARPVAQPA